MHDIAKYYRFEFAALNHLLLLNINDVIISIRMINACIIIVLKIESLFFKIYCDNQKMTNRSNDNRNVSLDLNALTGVFLTEIF